MRLTAQARLFTLALLAGSAATLATAQAAAPSGGRLGFSLTSYPFALHRDAADCPDGLALSGGQLYLQSVSPAERARLTLAANQKEYYAKAFSTPDGVDLCDAGLAFPRPPQRSPQSKVSYGFNLDGTPDGAATASSCAHEKFTGTGGEGFSDNQGVDNQAYRVLGCILGYRGQDNEKIGYLDAIRDGALRDGATTILIELTGIDDLKNDPDIKIGIYNGTDPMVQDTSGALLPDASLSVTEDPRYRMVAQGHIENGVIAMDPSELRLRYDVGGHAREYHIRGAKLRLERQADGNAKGLLGGYVDISDIDVLPEIRARLTDNAGYDCPAFKQAIRRYADGYPDPATGQCTALSAAFHIEAIPAFIIHPEQRPQTAQAKSAPVGGPPRR